MEVSIEHPTNRPNYCRLSLGQVVIYFSYRTPIAFHAPTTGRVVRENDWGPTTGKHLNEVDHGRKADRVDGETFRTMLAEVLAPIGASIADHA